MAEFADCDEGWVNLAFVATITEAPQKKGDGQRFFLRGADGKILGTSSRYDPMMAGGIMVPAAQGSYAIAVYVGKDESWCPHIPIVAWRVQTDCPAVPVLVDDTEGSDLVLIPAPDGSFIAQYSGVFKSVDDAIEHVKQLKASRTRPESRDPP